MTAKSAQKKAAIPLMREHSQDGNLKKTQTSGSPATSGVAARRTRVGRAFALALLVTRAHAKNWSLCR